LKKREGVGGYSELRSRAEEAVKKRKTHLGIPATEAETKKLLHELQVHQIELEMQNDELKKAKEEIESEYQRYADLYDFAPIGYVTLGISGDIEAINLTGARLLGMERYRLLKNRFALFLADDYLAVFNSFLDKVFERKGKEHCQVVLKNQNLFLYIEGTALHGGQNCRIILVDITDRVKAEEEIKRLNEELERKVAQLLAANEELEAFNYSVSHDLRAPLRHISSFVTLLEKKLKGQPDKDSNHYLEAISSASANMNKLIDDLLNLSHIGRKQLQKRKVRLNDLVREVVSDIQEQSTGREIIWEIDDLPVVYGDRSLLKLALHNLTSNAVKYSRPQHRAEIRVGCKHEESEVVCSVKDNGVGFDMKYADKLFGVFQRLHTSEQFEGTGIGLANVRRIIDRHGGRTWADSIAGKGATFYFTLPIEMCVGSE